MQAENLIPVSWRARPRSFVALMSLYESSFLRLHELCGDVSSLAGERRSQVAGDCELMLTVLEQTPYTTSLSLTYLFEADSPSSPLRLPDVEIRVYGDARLAEARRWAPNPAHPALRALQQPVPQGLDERWRRNSMLNKWLEYCLERGHRFT